MRKKQNNKNKKKLHSKHKGGNHDDAPINDEYKKYPKLSERARKFMEREEQKDNGIVLSEQGQTFMDQQEQKNEKKEEQGNGLISSITNFFYPTSEKKTEKNESDGNPMYGGKKHRKNRKSKKSKKNRKTKHKKKNKSNKRRKTKKHSKKSRHNRRR
tara:strand:+ start:147 stop:617 length:471 start_codon:yes stop_codon:yes gene_type:complete